MSIKKRRSKVRIKPKPKSKHERLCTELYNRLQADDSDNPVLHAIELIADRTGINHASDYHFIESILARTSTELVTLQMNYPDHVSYRVHMKWADYAGKRVYGNPPTKAVVISSPRLIRAVIIAYVLLSKKAGKFV